jgi:TolA-binding protein
MEVFMKRGALLLISVMAFGILGWTAEPAPVQSLSAYLDQLQVKLEHTAQRANQPSSSGSSVVGLRGSKQEPTSKQLYWKGKTGTAPVTPEEVKIFRTAIEQAKAGQNDQAVATLKAFVEKYPKSGLVADAKDTLKLIDSTTPAIATTPIKS